LQARPAISSGMYAARVPSPETIDCCGWANRSPRENRGDEQRFRNDDTGTATGTGRVQPVWWKRSCGGACGVGGEG
jgi:hypothetical protein